MSGRKGERWQEPCHGRNTVPILCIGKAHHSPECPPTGWSLPVPGKNSTVTCTLGFQGGLERGEFTMGWRDRREGVGNEKWVSPPRVPATEVS